MALKRGSLSKQTNLKPELATLKLHKCGSCHKLRPNSS